jgi:RsiW-degrading membrane proteinase PrsW (M82 family)
MEFIIIILVAILPAVLLWWYIWKKDQKKEPTEWLRKATLYGVLICFPVAIVELLISTVLFYPDGSPSTIVGTTVEAFFVAAIPEESFKLLALWLVLKKNPYFDEHFDGIVYAVCVGLGFAALENVGYLFNNIDNWMSVALLRSLLTVPGHYAFAVLMGYYYSKYHFVDHSRRTAALVIVAPVLVHGLYDALLMTSMVNEVLGGICFVVVVVLTCKLHVYARKKVLSMIDANNQIFRKT